MKHTHTVSRHYCNAALLTLGILLAPSSLNAATLVSHWTMDNPGPYNNEVGGGPLMTPDGSTAAPSTFDGASTRLESGSPSTRIFATSTALNINTFSFSVIIDPTDITNFSTILQKESGAPDTFADFQRIGWQVQHTEFGNLEFVVRGTDPGTKDFFGSTTVLGSNSGFVAGSDFGSDTLFQLAGGYDSTTGQVYFYVNQLGGTVVSNTGNTATFDTGAMQDTSALSLGSALSGSDYVGNGAGFDVEDLQVYDGLLSESELLFLANNPGMSIPEPSSVLMAGLGIGAVFFTRRRIARA